LIVTPHQLHTVLEHLHRAAGSPGADDLTDRQLLHRFARQRDEEAFAALVRRHAALVFGVCHRILFSTQDAEDVFQATFLVLARKAASTHWRESIGNWLYEVAHRLAMKTRSDIVRRHIHEKQAADRGKIEVRPEETWQELCGVLDEELRRLPERYRQPLLMCYLEGQTRDQAARRLGWSLRTLHRRLERGLGLLRTRLMARGLALPATLLAAGMSQQAATASVSTILLSNTVRAALAFTAKAEEILTPAAMLAEGGLRNMAMVKAKITFAVLLAGSMLAAGAGVLAHRQLAATRPEDKTEARTPQPPPGPEPATAAKERTARGDRFGDPLPVGAIQRFGTSRFWAEHYFMTAAVSPDGKLIASGHDRGSLRLWDAATGKQLRVLEGRRLYTNGSDALLAVVFSPDGKLLATRSGGSIFRDNSIRIWDTATWQQIRSFGGFKLNRDRGSGNANPFFDLVFTPDGKALLTGPGDNEDKTHFLNLFDVQTGQLLRQFKGHQAKVTCFTIAPDGQTAATGSADKTVRLWSLTTGKELHQFKDHKDEIRAVAFSPDSKFVASSGGDKDNTVRLWDVAAGKLVRKLTRFFNNRCATALVFTPDGKTLLAGDGQGAVTFWNVEKGVVREEIEGVHPQAIGLLSLSGDGKRLLVLGNYGNNFLTVWDVAAKRPLLPDIKHHFSDVSALALSADGKWLASAGKDKQAWIWDFASARVVRQLPPEQGEIKLLLFPDTKTLYTGGFMMITPRLWEVPSGRLLKSLDGFAVAAAFSADGKWFANAWPREVRLFDRKTGRLSARHQLPQNDSVVRKSMAFTPDGKYLLWSDRSGLSAMEAATGRIDKRIGQVAHFDLFFTLSPEGDLIAATEGSFALWDWRRGVRLRSLAVKTKPVLMPQEIQFSAAGRWLAAVGSDNILRVWEAASGQEVRNYRLYDQNGGWARLSTLVFAPDGRTVITGDTAAQILQWDLTGRLRDGQLQPAALTKADLSRHWDNLAGADGEKAYDSLWAFVSNPQATLPFFQQKLTPAPAIDDQRIAKHIQALDSEDFAQRERAMKELAKLEELAEPALRKAQEAKPSLEVKRRIDLLLDNIRDTPLSSDKLRQVRAVTILEQIGPAKAQDFIERLAKGAPAARQTREAQRVLRHWAQSKQEK
jgi:RNA polymerase sigma factor (sigma-70 family)